ncbi:hypothetical protein [Pinibacter aurantiacus]|uniref:hypothetical protein n=1 Tax=Pinibacter aurantiacus TaxID=2851599 RepID=UPI001E4BF7DF|nr:hypothetical protein [Pinibacter aurantiacus]
MWGHEFSVTTKNLVGELKWNTSFILSFDRNLITNLIDPGYIRRNNTVTSDYYRQQVGHHLGEFYGFVFEGLYKDANDLASSAKYQATTANPNGSSDVGTIKVKDINKDGVIDDVNDRTFIGDPTPTFTGGLVNRFTYKHFDLGIDMTFSEVDASIGVIKGTYNASNYQVYSSVNCLNFFDYAVRNLRFKRNKSLLIGKFFAVQVITRLYARLSVITPVFYKEISRN